MITGFTLGRIRVPLKTPFKTALRTVEEIDDLVIVLQDSSGAIGIGASPATPQITGATHQSSTEAIEQFIFPAIQGKDPADIAQLCKIVQACVPKANNAKSAVEIALYDLWAKGKNMPLYRALGGTTTELTTSITISSNPVFEMISDIEKAITRGFKTIKLKAGKDWESDKIKLKKIHHYVASLINKIDIIVDANQGWTAEQTIEIVKACETSAMKLKAIEQPVKHNDIQGLIQVKSAISTPLMVDETAFSLKQVQYLLDNSAADMVNVKLVKSGGISQAIEIGKFASSRMVPCMMGCMLEGSIGAAAAAHVAAAFPREFSMLDIDGPALGQYDPVADATIFNNAKITLGSGPGLGIKVLPTLLANDY